MRLNTAKWRGFDVDLGEGAILHFAPIGFEAGMAIDSIMAEINRRGSANLLELSPQSRADIMALIRQHLVGWDGIEDENGQPMPYDWKAFERYFDRLTWPVIFWQMFQAQKPTEDERKNSSTASKSASSAPAISIADDAAPTGSSLVEKTQP